MSDAPRGPLHRARLARPYRAATRLVAVVGLLLAVSSPSAATDPQVPASRPPGPGLKSPATPPYFLTDLKETARVARLPDGRLLAVFARNDEGTPELVARPSHDNGRTWGDVQLLTTLPKDDIGWAGPEPLVDHDEELHVFFLKSRKKLPSGLDIDIYHAKSSDGRMRWRPPRRIWEGYTGALNCLIQMRNGRILVPFSYLTGRTWAHRGEGFDQFTYMGTFDCTVLYSDDRGDTWRQSTTPLKVTAPDLGTYGAIEPVVVERTDGRVWMLLRTQHGRFYESLSDDGASWSKPRPSRILSSDSPAGLVRLVDGRIVLFWNNCLRFPYAYGGRHVMHGAISADDGKTWRGFREVARNPRRHEPPPPTGDHGASYPIPCAVNDGKVITTTGLPSPNYNLFVDPEWFYEPSLTEEFRDGLEGWSVFGVKGVELAPHPQHADRKVLAIRKTDPDWPAAAVWNFPAGTRGRLRLRMLLKAGFAGARLGITDHFSVPFDDLDEFHNLFNLPIASDGTTVAPGRLPIGRWFELEFQWDGDQRQCLVTVDGRRSATLRQNRESLGACYLRLIATATTTADRGLVVERVDASVLPGS
jgi:BNR repeat-like domain